MKANSSTYSNSLFQRTPLGGMFRRMSAVAILILGLSVPSSLVAQADSAEKTSAPRSGAPATDSVDMNGGIIYGQNYAYYLHADSGWVMDHALETTMSSNSVFYQQGYPPLQAPVYIVSLVWPRDSLTTVDHFILSYFNSFKTTYADGILDTCPSLPTAADLNLAVRQVSTDSSNYYERTAFYGAPGSVIGITMWSRYPRNFQDCLDSFARTVKSFRYLTNNVRIEPPTAHPDTTRK